MPTEVTDTFNRTHWADTAWGLQVWRTSSRASALLRARVIRPCWRFWRKRCVKKSNRHQKREAALAALRQQSERAELDLIRRRLKLPISKRMNFLRVRLPGGGSHL